MKPLVAVVGPTATGKSGLAVSLAKQFNGEVIGADSRQIYRYMDIGTAKISPDEQSGVHHYLIDIKAPDEDFSVAQYRQTATEIIGDIHLRNMLPVLAGGTGQYIWSVIEGWNIPEVQPDNTLRKELEEKAAAGGIEDLFDELREADPEAAASIDKRNVRRVIRALEVVRLTRRPFSEQKIKKEPPYRFLVLGLTCERKELYRRIDLRVDRMIERGFIWEVQGLLDRGYKSTLPAMSGIGYKQIVMYLNGELSLESAVEKIKTETHRLVRRQNNWFAHDDKRITWLDIQGDYFPEAEEKVRTFLETEQ